MPYAHDGHVHILCAYAFFPGSSLDSSRSILPSPYQRMQHEGCANNVCDKKYERAGTDDYNITSLVGRRG